LRISTDWKNADLIDYYYGVSQRNTELSGFPLKANQDGKLICQSMLQSPLTKTSHGFAIVNRTVDWHQGDCYVTDGKLGGAKFVMSLPSPFN